MIDPQEIIAAAIANARGNRRGVPEIVNILEILPEKLRCEVLDDADAVLAALRSAGILAASTPAEGGPDA